MDEKLKQRIENLKDMVLYRFGSTGVVQVLSRAAELLGLVPVFPVRSIHGFGAGGQGAAAQAAFRDCVLVKKGSTVGDVYRKVMGDAPLAFVETVGGVRVGEDDLVAVGKNDVSTSLVSSLFCLLSCGVSLMLTRCTDPVLQGRQGIIGWALVFLPAGCWMMDYHLHSPPSLLTHVSTSPT